MLSIWTKLKFCPLVHGNLGQDVGGMGVNNTLANEKSLKRLDRWCAMDETAMSSIQYTRIYLSLLSGLPSELVFPLLTTLWYI